MPKGIRVIVDLDAHYLPEGNHGPSYQEWVDYIEERLQSGMVDWSNGLGCGSTAIRAKCSGTPVSLSACIESPLHEKDKE
jgi:hypothetical protein